MTTQAKFDVVVVGAGNAAFSAALTAQQAGASVLVLEKAPEHARGGNTYFTGGAYRFAYNGFDEVHALVPDLSEGEAASMVVGSYTTADFRADLMRVTEGLSDEDLADTLVRQSYSTMEWLRDQGMRFIPLWTRQAFKEDGKFRFWGGLILEAVGAGKGLSDRFFELAAERGIEVRYASAASGLMLDSSGRVIGVTVRGPDGFYDVPAGSVVLACGGFEANAEMRTRYLGAGWELAKVRGVQTNTGDGISTRHPSATARWATSIRSTPIPSALSSTPRASASLTRAPTFATIRTPNTAARFWPNPSGWRSRFSTRRACIYCETNITSLR